jgi:hypothetical protein
MGYAKYPPQPLDEVPTWKKLVFAFVFGLGGGISFGLSLGLLYPGVPCNSRRSGLVFWFQDLSLRCTESKGTILLPGAPLGQWPLTSFGLAFMGFALVLLLSKRFERFRFGVMVFSVLAFIAPIAWVTYGSNKVGWDFKVMATFGIACAIAPLVLRKRFQDKSKPTAFDEWQKTQIEQKKWKK